MHAEIHAYAVSKDDKKDKMMSLKQVHVRFFFSHACVLIHRKEFVDV